MLPILSVPNTNSTAIGGSVMQRPAVMSVMKRNMPVNRLTPGHRATSLQRTWAKRCEGTLYFLISSAIYASALVLCWYLAVLTIMVLDVEHMSSVYKTLMSAGI